MATVQNLTGGQAVVQSLLAAGIDTVFGLPGAQTYSLLDALYHERGKIHYIGTRHEQGAGYMAFGYARSTGRPGVYTVVPGPGVLNSSAALCTAYGANAPVLCLTGQVPSRGIGSGRGYLHELPDQLGTLRSFCKGAMRITHPAAAPRLMAEALECCLSGRPGPVVVETPWDILDMKADVNSNAPDLMQPVPEPDPEAVASAIELINQSRQPMIMVGGGAMAANEEILELAGMIQAPVVSFRSGRGIVSNDSAYGLTCAEGYRAWDHTDCLIGIGTRLELPYMRWQKIPAELKVIRIDIDPAEMTRLKPDVGIVGDAAPAIRLLVDKLRPQLKPRRSREDELTDLKAVVEKQIRRIQPQMAYLDVIREVLPEDGIFIDELSQVGMTSWFGFPVYRPRTFISCGYQGTLGYGFNTALGVKVANPDKPVVSVNGDGGFMFGVQELATAVQYGIDLVAIVFNNHSWENVRRDQMSKFNGHVYGAELRNPDFVRLAESFGAAAYRSKSPDELRTALEKAFTGSAPAVIEVPVETGAEAAPWDFLMPGTY